MTATEPTEALQPESVPTQASLDADAIIAEPLRVEPSEPKVLEETPSLAWPDIAESADGRRLFLSDLRVAFLLANHARHRAVARLFGVSEDQANMVTLIALLMVADKAYAGITRVVRVPAPPSWGDGLLVGGAVRASARGIVGPAASDTPLLGVLVVAAVVGTTLRPAVAKSIHEIRTSSHRMALGFHHRYGYLVDPGHWRERRARDHAARA
jgi:hypothetical protein